MSDVSSTVNLTINDLPVRVPAGTTLLEAAQTLGIRIPILCYDKQLTVSGACRICVVEVANPRGSTRLEPACSFPAQEGMSVRTNTRELRDARRTIIELILANHPRACQTCIRNERCNLQALCREYSIEKIRYEGERRHHDIDTSSVAITRHPDFCILCGKCVKVCREVQGVYALDFVKRGFSTTVSPPFDRDLADTVCVLCGQCLLKCPVAAIRDKSYIKTIADALEDPQRIVTVQIAPSVRATVGELFGLPPDVSLTLKLPTALRRLGFRYVFDKVHFLEVMACPGGCIGGGGQPLPTDEETRRRRIEAMYAEDRGMTIRQAHKSPAVQTIYNEFLGKPCSEKAHHLLHTKYAPRLPRGF